MPAAMLEEQRWLGQGSTSRSSPTRPACARSDIPGLADAYDGIDVKLDKAGGMLRGAAHDPHGALLRAQDHARLHDLELGERSPPPPTCRRSWTYADLDGNLLIANDPYTGVAVRDGRLVLNDRPGLGLVRSAA